MSGEILTLVPVAKLDATDGATGTRQSFVRRAQGSVFGIGGSLYGGGAFGASPNDGFSAASRNGANRESGPVAALAAGLLTSTPILATLTENLATQAVGTGLTLSAKPDAVALGITPDQARQLSMDLEREFKQWAANPREVDLAGRSNLHQLVFAAFVQYLIHGEVLATVDWLRARDKRYGTCISLLHPEQLDRTYNRALDGEGVAYAGVATDKRGRITGYYLKAYTPGRQYPTVMPTFVPIANSWGRLRVLHAFDLRGAGQFRGLSPLVAALAPALEKAQLAEFALEAALIGTAFAATIESDLPANDVYRTLSQDPSEAAFNPLAGFAEDRREFFQQNTPQMKPGQFNVLPQGDKMRFNKSEAPNATFDVFDRSLDRSAAKAAGSSYEETSGDLSKTSFSASRLALELPFRINLRRRALIAERMYLEAYKAFAEEAIVTGRVKNPSEVPFWEQREAYTKCKFLGLGRVTADPKKDIEYKVMAIANGLMTRTDALAEMGIDFDEQLENMVYERDRLLAAGFNPLEVGAMTTQKRETEALPPNPDDEE